MFVEVLGDLHVTSYWIDTFVLKNRGKYLRYFAASPFPLQGKTNACSRGSKKDFWRRCRGDLRSSQDIPSTRHKLLSLALHYLPFASRFPLPHFTLAILFALSLSILPLYLPLFAHLLLFARVLDCLLVVMTSLISSALSPKSEVLNFKQREGENLKDAWYRICNAKNKSTRKQSTTILLRNFYVGITPGHRYVLDTITGGNF